MPVTKPVFHVVKTSLSSFNFASPLKFLATPLTVRAMDPVLSLLIMNPVPNVRLTLLMVLRDGDYH
jgi:hypothetical protein